MRLAVLENCLIIIPASLDNATAKKCFEYTEEDLISILEVDCVENIYDKCNFIFKFEDEFGPYVFINRYESSISLEVDIIDYFDIYSFEKLLNYFNIVCKNKSEKKQLKFLRDNYKDFFRNIIIKNVIL